MSIESLRQKERYDFDDLRQIVAILRSPEGCPWDRVQTHESIRNNFLEEVYETVDTLDRKDLAGMREELGDVLFQVAFHAQIEQECGHFDLADVCDEICRKMVIRHPHVFGEQIVDRNGKALRDWEAIKEQTHDRTTGEEALRDIPTVLPALLRGEKLGKKSRKYGFDWTDADDALLKVDEELAEVRHALAENDPHAIKEEFGDLLLAVCSAARLAGVCAEEALTFACEKYIDRFAAVEKQCVSDGKQMQDCSRADLQMYWQQAKKDEIQ